MIIWEFFSLSEDYELCSQLKIPIFSQTIFSKWVVFLLTAPFKASGIDPLIGYWNKWFRSLAGWYRRILSGW